MSRQYTAYFREWTGEKIIQIKKLWFDTKAHTLIEMVLVLLLLSVLLLIPLLSFSPLHEKLHIDHFLNVLSEDIRFAQQFAYANETVVYFRFQQNTYEVRKSGQAEPLIARTFMESISFQPVTLSPSEIRFNSKGNISKAGTIFIETPIKRYRLVFLIGRGGFYIE